MMKGKFNNRSINKKTKKQMYNVTKKFMIENNTKEIGKDRRKMYSTIK